MEEKLLGCKAAELEVGTEFSHDEGFTWGVVKAIKYVSDDSTELDIWVQPSDNTSLSASYNVVMEEGTHVLLERNWKG